MKPSSSNLVVVVPVVVLLTTTALLKNNTASFVAAIVAAKLVCEGVRRSLFGLTLFSEDLPGVMTRLVFSKWVLFTFLFNSALAVLSATGLLKAATLFVALPSNHSATMFCACVFVGFDKTAVGLVLLALLHQQPLGRLSREKFCEMLNVFDQTASVFPPLFVLSTHTCLLSCALDGQYLASYYAAYFGNFYCLFAATDFLVRSLFELKPKSDRLPKQKRVVKKDLRVPAVVLVCFFPALLWTLFVVNVYTQHKRPLELDISWIDFFSPAQLPDVMLFSSLLWSASVVLFSSVFLGLSRQDLKGLIKKGCRRAFDLTIVVSLSVLFGDKLKELGLQEIVRSFNAKNDIDIFWLNIFAFCTPLFLGFITGDAETGIIPLVKILLPKVSKNPLLLSTIVSAAYMGENMSPISELEAYTNTLVQKYKTKTRNKNKCRFDSTRVSQGINVYAESLKRNSFVFVLSGLSHLSALWVNHKAVLGIGVVSIIVKEIVSWTFYPSV